ncbi:MAG: inorganic phosphate transporter [Desulfomonilaceae bacterium]
MEISEILHLPTATLVALLAAFMVAITFEAVNGFHDAATAVATVIYTNSLRPRIAVILSGIFNFLGVYVGGMGVAFAIVHLLPTDLLVNVGSRAGAAMIFSILISAIMWNFATWYKGIPASSSHTLIGAIVGVGLANALVCGQPVFQAAHFRNVEAVFLSLLISPLLGFVLAAALLLLLRKSVRDRRLYEPPEGRKPPAWVRAILVITSSGVSLAHGSNDGQKGVGLIMIILIASLPAHFALNPEYRTGNEISVIQSLGQAERVIQSKKSVMVSQLRSQETEMDNGGGLFSSKPLDPVSLEIEGVIELLKKQDALASMTTQERSQLRKRIVLLEDHIRKLKRSRVLNLSDSEKAIIDKARSELRRITDYAPTWVILLVAAAIGFGTMFGWKRVVVTVGEKIGKNPLTYAQGASSQMVAMLTIGLAAVMGLPVSTTHVLSSGVTGSMVANKVGLKYGTLREIAMAWLFTFPVTMLLAGALFLIFR